MSASIEIPGRSSIHNSEQDFVVISESPVVQLSEGDVLDGLEVKMDSFPIQSISLKDDIDRLTRENEQLKQTALNDGQAIKKHLRLCTEYKEQMTKCHERDATMLEEARQATLKLRKENEALTDVLNSVRAKLEDAVIREYTLKTDNTKLESELGKLREELAVCQKAEEEAHMRADLASYVNIDGSTFETENELKAEIAELQKKLEAAEQQRQNDSVVDRLEDKMEELLKELTAAQAAREELEEDMKLKEQKWEQELKKLMENQTKQDSKDEVVTNQADLEQIKQSSFEDGVASQNRKLEAIMAKLTQANMERDLLREKFEVAEEERRKLAAEMRTMEGRSEEILRDNLAAFKCLQSEQASQIEALKLALRSEQSLREKAETDYASLLETWQNFERNYQPPVDLADEIARPPSELDRAAQNLATADRLRLEADARTLRETIKDLQAQNMRLLEELQLSNIQQAGAASAAAATAGARPRAPVSPTEPARDGAAGVTYQQEERKCPICMTPFENQADLIQHAGICDNELASMF